jgi:oligosaccharide repeat unit polymerase
MIPNAPALALGIVLIAWATWMRILAGTWLQPSAFFALWWCFAGILPLVFAPNEAVGPNAMLWLISASIAVSLGALAGNYGFKTKLSAARAPATDRELLVFQWLVVASIIFGLASNIAFVVGSGIPLSEVLNVEQLVVVSNQLYVERFAETAPDPPMLSRALLPFVYLAPLAGGILFVLRKEKRWKLVGLLSFIPPLGVTILQTTKAAVLYSLILWLSGYFAARLRAGKLAVFTKSHFVVAAGVGAAMTTLFLATSLARLASTDASLLNIVIVKLFTSAFGHMSVFSQWLADYWAAPFGPSFGTVTFAGPLELLGYSHRIPGLFEQIIELVAGEMSNIYTGFRPLIQDFTIPGALAVLAALGFVGGLGFRLVALGRWSGLPLLLIAYVTTMWTPITWIWIYNSVTASVLAIAVVLLFIRIWRGGLNSGRMSLERQTS